MMLPCFTMLMFHHVMFHPCFTFSNEVHSTFIGRTGHLQTLHFIRFIVQVFRCAATFGSVTDVFRIQRSKSPNKRGDWDILSFSILDWQCNSNHVQR